MKLQDNKNWTLTYNRSFDENYNNILNWLLVYKYPLTLISMLTDTTVAHKKDLNIDQVHF